MKDIYIPANEIIRTKQSLGKGNFGEVTRGKYGNKEICIKTCRSEASTISVKVYQDIFEEAVQMKRFEHGNVMKIYGVSVILYHSNQEAMENSSRKL